ncbi:DUF2971 domain-containing protein [Stutzerimonas sp.]|uniref:DUF2971 domain-containing protein n=1 Tax=Stutzerimonas sp. TaxID=2901166 RepID=UPI0035AE7E4E
MDQEIDGTTVLRRYKYLPFNEGSLNVLTQGTLKFTCPSDFNDPFDCYPAFDPSSIENIAKLRPDLFKAVGKAEGLSPAKRLQRHGIYKTKIKRAVESGEYAKGLVQNLGVCCLSRNPTSILMWSHYANNHTGFVVEFEIPMNAPLPLLTQIVPLPVVYQKRRPMLAWGDKNFDIESYFLTKSEDWEYEAEERILTSHEGPGFHPYSRSHFLSSVIAGARMDEKNLTALERTVAQVSGAIGRHVGFYRAQLAADEYRVIVPGRLI